MIFARLTPLGKAVVLGGFVLLMGLVYWGCFGRSEQVAQGPDLTRPYNLQLTGYQFPFGSGQQEAFARQQIEVPNYCQFFTYYAENRGLPLRFDAFVVSDPHNSPYYMYDRDSDLEYLPAYYVPQGGKGIQDALKFANDELENLPDCAKTTGSSGLILLAFPRGRAPVSPLVRVQGVLWWDSVDAAAALNVNQPPDIGQAPVVRVGAYTDLSPRQSADPPVAERVLNVAVQTGGGVVRVGRIEYGASQTRLHVQLSNRSNRILESWSAADVRLQPRGQSALAPSLDGDALNGVELPATINDLLPADSLQPGSAGRLDGYLLFAKVDHRRPQTLYLPPLGQQAPFDTGTPIAISIPPSSAR